MDTRCMTYQAYSAQSIKYIRRGGDCQNKRVKHCNYAIKQHYICDLDVGVLPIPARRPCLSGPVYLLAVRSCSMANTTIRCYTDGSSLGNPWPGWRAAIIVFPERQLPEIEGSQSKSQQTEGGEIELAEIELSWWEKYTTNNRMELLAATRTLYKLLGVDELPVSAVSSQEGLFGDFGGENEAEDTWGVTKSWVPAEKFLDHVIISTDSEYVQKWVSEYLAQRKIRNRRTVGRKPVQHRDLWQLIDMVLPIFSNLKRERVKGHSWHRMNERVDQLARSKAMNEAMNEDRRQ